MINAEVEITQENFHLYFYDVRTHQPKRGQVISRYAAVADFIDGELKRDIIEMLQSGGSIDAVVKYMRKVGLATERDSIAVPLEMSRDLFSGLTNEQVAQKPYKFVCEAFFYTKKENIPSHDAHWSCVSIANLDEFIDAKEQRVTLKGRILKDDENPGDMSTYRHVTAGCGPTNEGFNDNEADAGSIRESEFGS